LSAVVCGVALAQSLPALAGAVTDADLRGKKILGRRFVGLLLVDSSPTVATTLP
jgi:hypothetical protein